MAERLAAVLPAPARAPANAEAAAASWIPAFVCVAAHLAIVLPLAAILGLGVDEAYSLHTSSGGIAHALDRALHFEMQPPAFFVALAAWRTFGEGVFVARLLSITFTSLAILVGARLSRRFFPQMPGWCVPAALALNPMLVECAVNIRVYALLALLSGVLLLLFHDAFVSERGGRARARVLYVAVSVLALYSQYYLGFLLVANFAALVAMRRWRPAAVYLGCMAVVALALVPLFAVTLTQFKEHTHTVDQGETLRAGFSDAARHAENLVLSQHKVTFGRAVRWLLRLGVYGLVGLGALAVLRRGRGALREVLATSPAVPLGAALAVVVVFFAVTATVVGKDLVALRHATGMIFPSLFFFYALFALGRPRLVAPLATVLILLMSANALYAFYTPVGAFPPAKVMAAYVERTETPNQPVVVFPSDSVLPFDIHYDGKNRLVPVPERPSLVHYDLSRFVLHDEAHARQALAQALRGQRECWLVLFEAVDGMGVNVNAPHLEAVVRSHFAVLSKRQFEYATVRRLRQVRPLDRP